MSCDLSDPKLAEAYEQIISGADVIWLAAGYNGTRDKISLYTTGKGDAEEMRQYVLKMEEVLYLFVRVENKYALITFISEKATGVKRARALVHGRSIGNLFANNNLQMTVSTALELRENNLRSKLRIDGSASSIGKLGSRSSLNSKSGTKEPGTAKASQLNRQTSGSRLSAGGQSTSVRKITGSIENISFKMGGSASSFESDTPAENIVSTAEHSDVDPEGDEEVQAEPEHLKSASLNVNIDRAKRQSEVSEGGDFSPTAIYTSYAANQGASRRQSDTDPLITVEKATLERRTDSIAEVKEMEDDDDDDEFEHVESIGDSFSRSLDAVQDSDKSSSPKPPAKEIRPPPVIKPTPASPPKTSPSLPPPIKDIPKPTITSTPTRNTPSQPPPIKSPPKRQISAMSAASTTSGFALSATKVHELEHDIKAGNVGYLSESVNEGLSWKRRMYRVSGSRELEIYNEKIETSQDPKCLRAFALADISEVENCEEEIVIKYSYKISFNTSYAKHLKNSDYYFVYFETKQERDSFMNRINRQ